VKLAHMVDRTDGEITIVLAGEADSTTIDRLREILFDAVALRPTLITVDLRGLVFIDSSSIGALVAARRAAVERGCEFRVGNPHGQVLRVLTVAGVLGALTGADSSGQAGRGAGAAPCA
jgi:anti-sigma B factor antagonist